MEDLLRRSIDGDASAFAALMRRHTQYLYKVAWTQLGHEQDVADALQETAFACWRKLKSLQKPEYFRTWMTRILINECNKILRARPRTVSLEETSTIVDETARADGEDWRDVLGMLDEKYRLAMYLHYVEGFKAREIAEMTDVAVSTITTRLERGRKKLEEAWRSTTSEGARV